MKITGRLLTAAAIAALGISAATPQAFAGAASSDAQTINTLMRELDDLEAELDKVEATNAVKRLQKAYGYYLDKGMWGDLAELFADDAVAAYPAGVFVGKKSITEHIWKNVGGGETIGLAEGRLYNHMVLQPVVNVMPDGQTAKGRWRVLAQLGRYPTGNAAGSASWAGGVYENTYVKQNGVWKIKDLTYYSSFSAPYEGGWAKVTPLPTPPRAGGPGGPGGARPPGAGPAGGPAAAPPPAVTPVAAPVPPPAAPRNLAHPADRPRNQACPGFPYACIEPFHYNNPVTGRETK